MSEAKFRIPKLAMAVMVLGANGCGDDDGDAKTPNERYAGIAKDTCRLVFSCGDDSPFAPEDPNDVSFSTEKECVEQFTEEVKSEFAGVSTKCRDAFLDFYECYVDAGCDADVEKDCAKLAQKYYELCEDEE